MTHPTIEAAQKAIAEAYEPGAHNSKAEAKAAARVILSAPPSEAEMEAALTAYIGGDWAALVMRVCGGDEPDRIRAEMREALAAFLAKRLEELEGK